MVIENKRKPLGKAVPTNYLRSRRVVRF